MMGRIIWVLLEIYLAFQQWKNFENPLKIDKVIAMSSVCSFLAHPVGSFYVFNLVTLGVQTSRRLGYFPTNFQ